MGEEENLFQDPTSSLNDHYNLMMQKYGAPGTDTDSKEDDSNPVKPQREILPGDPDYKEDLLKAIYGRGGFEGSVESSFIDYQPEDYHTYEQFGADYNIFNPELSQDQRSDAQGNWSKLGSSALRIIPNIALDVIGGTGAILDLADYMNRDGEVGNAITRWADEKKKYVNEELAPIHQRRDTGMGDMGWWIENGGSLVSSIAAFGTLGGAVSKTAAGLFGGLAKLSRINNARKALDVGRNASTINKEASRIAKFFGARPDIPNIGVGLATQFTTAAALTQAEAIMSATETFKSTYDEAIARGLNDNRAKEIAGAAAAHTININRLNFALNLTSASRFFKSSQAIRQSNKARKELEKRIKSSKGIKKAALMAYKKKHYLGESLQEGAEEYVNLLSEIQGKELGKKYIDGKRETDEGALTYMTNNMNSEAFNRALQTAISKEGLESMVLGAIGGAGQTLVTDQITDRMEMFGDKVVKRDAQGNPVYKKVDEKWQTDAPYYVGERLENDITLKDGTTLEKGHIVTEEDLILNSDELKRKKGTTRMMQSSWDNKVRSFSQAHQVDSNEFEYEQDGARISKRNQAALEEKNDPIIKSTGEKIIKDIIDTSSDVISTFDHLKAAENYHSLYDQSTSPQDKEIYAEELARYNVSMHPTSSKLEGDEKRKAIDNERNRILSLTPSQVETEVDMVNNRSLAMQYWKAFNNNTIATLEDIFISIRDMTPEQAIEKGYSEDYKQKAEHHLEDMEKLYKAYRDYTGGVYNNRDSQALFMNRAEQLNLYRHLDNLNAREQEIMQEDADRSQRIANYKTSLDGFNQLNDINSREREELNTINEKRNNVVKKISELNRRAPETKLTRQINDVENKISKSIDETELRELETRLKELEIKRANVAASEIAKFEATKKEESKKLNNQLKELDKQINDARKKYNKERADNGLIDNRSVEELSMIRDKIQSIDKRIIDNDADFISIRDGNVSVNFTRRFQNLQEAAKRLSFGKMMKKFMDMQQNTPYKVGDTITRDIVSNEQDTVKMFRKGHVVTQKDLNNHGAVLHHGDGYDFLYNTNKIVKPEDEAAMVILNLANKESRLYPSILNNAAMLDSIYTEFFNIYSRMADTSRLDKDLIKESFDEMVRDMVDLSRGFNRFTNETSRGIDGKLVEEGGSYYILLDYEDNIYADDLEASNLLSLTDPNGNKIYKSEKKENDINLVTLAENEYKVEIDMDNYLQLVYINSSHNERVKAFSAQVSLLKNRSNRLSNVKKQIQRELDSFNNDLFDANEALQDYKNKANPNLIRLLDLYEDITERRDRDLAEQGEKYREDLFEPGYGGTTHQENIGGQIFYTDKNAFINDQNTEMVYFFYNHEGRTHSRNIPLTALPYKIVEEDESTLNDRQKKLRGDTIMVKRLVRYFSRPNVVFAEVTSLEDPEFTTTVLLEPSNVFDREDSVYMGELLDDATFREYLDTLESSNVNLEEAKRGFMSYLINAIKEIDSKKQDMASNVSEITEQIDKLQREIDVVDSIIDDDTLASISADYAKSIENEILQLKAEYSTYLNLESEMMDMMFRLEYALDIKKGQDVSQEEKQFIENIALPLKEKRELIRKIVLPEYKEPNPEDLEKLTLLDGIEDVETIEDLLSLLSEVFPSIKKTVNEIKAKAEVFNRAYDIDIVQDLMMSPEEKAKIQAEKQQAIKDVILEQEPDGNDVPPAEDEIDIRNTESEDLPNSRVEATAIPNEESPTESSDETVTETITTVVETDEEGEQEFTITYEPLPDDEGEHLIKDNKLKTANPGLAYKKHPKFLQPGTNRPLFVNDHVAGNIPYLNANKKSNDFLFAVNALRARDLLKFEDDNKNAVLGEALDSSERSIGIRVVTASDNAVRNSKAYSSQPNPTQLKFLEDRGLMAEASTGEVQLSNPSRLRTYLSTYNIYNQSPKKKKREKEIRDKLLSMQRGQFLTVEELDYLSRYSAGNVKISRDSSDPVGEGKHHNVAGEGLFIVLFDTKTGKDIDVRMNGIRGVVKTIEDGAAGNRIYSNIHSPHYSRNFHFKNAIASLIKGGNTYTKWKEFLRGKVIEQLEEKGIDIEIKKHEDILQVAEGKYDLSEIKLSLERGGRVVEFTAQDIETIPFITLNDRVEAVKSTGEFRGYPDVDTYIKEDPLPNIVRKKMSDLVFRERFQFLTDIRTKLARNEKVVLNPNTYTLSAGSPIRRGFIPEVGPDIVHLTHPEKGVIKGEEDVKLLAVNVAQPEPTNPKYSRTLLFADGDNKTYEFNRKGRIGGLYLVLKDGTVFEPYRSTIGDEKADLVEKIILAHYDAKRNYDKNKESEGSSERMTISWVNQDGDAILDSKLQQRDKKALDVLRNIIYMTGRDSRGFRSSTTLYVGIKPDSASETLGINYGRDGFVSMNDLKNKRGDYRNFRNWLKQSRFNVRKDSINDTNYMAPVDIEVDSDSGVIRVKYDNTGGSYLKYLLDNQVLYSDIISESESFNLTKSNGFRSAGTNISFTPYDFDAPPVETVQTIKRVKKKPKPRISPVEASKYTDIPLDEIPTGKDLSIDFTTSTPKFSIRMYGKIQFKEGLVPVFNYDNLTLVQRTADGKEKVITEPSTIEKNISKLDVGKFLINILPDAVDSGKTINEIMTFNDRLEKITLNDYKAESPVDTANGGSLNRKKPLSSSSTNPESSKKNAKVYFNQIIYKKHLSLANKLGFVAKDLSDLEFDTISGGTKLANMNTKSTNGVITHTLGINIDGMRKKSRAEQSAILLHELTHKAMDLKLHHYANLAKEGKDIPDDLKNLEIISKARDKVIAYTISAFTRNKDLKDMSKYLDDPVNLHKVIYSLFHVTHSKTSDANTIKVIKAMVDWIMDKGYKTPESILENIQDLYNTLDKLGTSVSQSRYLHTELVANAFTPGDSGIQDYLAMIPSVEEDKSIIQSIRDAVVSLFDFSKLTKNERTILDDIIGGSLAMFEAPAIQPNPIEEVTEVTEEQINDVSKEPSLDDVSVEDVINTNAQQEEEEDINIPVEASTENETVPEDENEYGISEDVLDSITGDMDISLDPIKPDSEIDSAYPNIPLNALSELNLPEKAEKSLTKLLNSNPKVLEDAKRTISSGDYSKLFYDYRLSDEHIDKINLYIKMKFPNQKDKELEIFNAALQDYLENDGQASESDVEKTLKAHNLINSIFKITKVINNLTEEQVNSISNQTNLNMNKSHTYLKLNTKKDLSEVQKQDMLAFLSYNMYDSLLNKAENVAELANSFNNYPLINQIYEESFNILRNRARDYISHIDSLKEKLGKEKSLSPNQIMNYEKFTNLIEALDKPENLRLIRTFHINNYLASKNIDLDSNLLDELDSIGEDDITGYNVDEIVDRDNQNTMDMLSVPLKILLGAVPRTEMRKGKRKLITNSLLVPYSEPTQHIKNILFKNLSNITPTYEAVMGRFDELIKREYNKEVAGYYGLTFIKKHLEKFRDDSDVFYVSLRNSFIQTFAKADVKFFTGYVTRDNQMLVVDENHASYVNKIRRQWVNNVHNRVEDFNRSRGIQNTGMITKEFADYIKDIAFKGKIERSGDIIDIQGNKNRKIEALRALGIDLSEPDSINNSTFTGMGTSFEQAASSFINILLSDYAISKGLNIDSIFDYQRGNVYGFLRSALNYEKRLNTAARDIQVQNSKGNTVTPSFLHDFISASVAKINTYTKLEDLQANMPHLFTPFNRSSLFKRHVIDNYNTIGHKPALETTIISGSRSELRNVGKDAADLTPSDRIRLYLHLMLNRNSRVYPAPQSADRRRTVGIRLEGRNTLLAPNTQAAKTILLEHMIDEMMSIDSFVNRDVGKDIMFYSDKGDKFAVMSGILDKSLQDSLITLVKASPGKYNKLSALRNYDKENGTSLVKQATENISNFLQEKKEEMHKYLSDNSILIKSYDKYGRGEVIFRGEGLPRLSGISDSIILDYARKLSPDDSIANMDSIIDAIVADFSNNLAIGYLEYIKAFTGSPSMFKNVQEYFKRMKMFTSTSKISVKGEKTEELFNKNNRLIDTSTGKPVSNEDFLAGNFTGPLKAEPGWRLDGKVADGTLSNVTLSDVSIKSLSANDRVEKVDISDGKLVYLDSEGRKTKPSLFTKVFAEGAYNQLKIRDKDLLNRKVNSLIRPYQNIDEADAEGWITLPAYREVMLRSDMSWSPKQEAAMLKVLRGEYLTYEEMTYFPPLKTQYTGYNSDYAKDGKLFSPTGYKHSIFPLIPTEDMKGTNLEKLMNKMYQNQWDIVQLTSANKFGAVLGQSGTNTMYKEDGSFNDTKWLSQRVPFDHFGIQVNIAAKRKSKTTVSSQSSKLSFVDFYEYGRLREGFTPEQGQIVNEYLRLRDRLIEKASEKFFDDLGISDKGMSSETSSLIASALFDSAIKHGGNISTIELIGELIPNDKDRPAKLEELIGNAKDVENMLFSLFHKKVRKQKWKGESTVLVSALGIEKGKRTLSDGQILSSNVLRFYREGINALTGEKALIPSDAYLPLDPEMIPWVQHLGDGDLSKGLRILNKMLKDLHNKLARIEEPDSKSNYNKDKEKLTKDEENLLKLTTVYSFRIPFQDAPSGDVYRIAKFLNPIYGPMSILPPEAIAKVGHDHDGDKVNFYFPSFIMKTDYTATTEERLKAILTGQELQMTENVRPIYIDYSNPTSSADLVNNEYRKYLRESLRKIILNKNNQNIKDSIEDAYSLVEPLIESLSTSIESQKALMSFIPISQEKINKLLDTYQSLDFIKSPSSIIIAKYEMTLAISRLFKFNLKDGRGFYDSLRKKDRKSFTEAVDSEKISKEYGQEVLRIIFDAKKSMLDIESDIVSKNSDIFNKDAFAQNLAENPMMYGSNEMLTNQIINNIVNSVTLWNNAFKLLSPITDGMYKADDDSFTMAEEFGIEWDIRFLQSDPNEYESKRQYLDARAAATADTDVKELFDRGIVAFVKEYKEKTSSVEASQLLSGVENANMTHRNLTGSQDIGKTAVNSTSHANFQKAGVHVNHPLIFTNQGIEDNANIYFPINWVMLEDDGISERAFPVDYDPLLVDFKEHQVLVDGNISGWRHPVTNDFIPVNSVFLPSISGSVNKDGDFISYLSSGRMNGFVDISKSFHMFTLNMAGDSFAVPSYMERLGLGLRWNARFVNMPSILNYVKLKQTYGSELAASSGTSLKDKAIGYAAMADYGATQRYRHGANDPKVRPLIKLVRANEWNNMSEADRTTKIEEIIERYNSGMWKLKDKIKIDKVRTNTYSYYLDLYDSLANLQFYSLHKRKERASRDYNRDKANEGRGQNLPSLRKNWHLFGYNLKYYNSNDDTIPKMRAYREGKYSYESLGDAIMFDGDEQKKTNLDMLEIYMEMERQALNLRFAIPSTNDDTKKHTTRSSLAGNMKNKQNTQSSDNFYNYDNILEETVIGSFANANTRFYSKIDDLYLFRRVRTENDPTSEIWRRTVKGSIPKIASDISDGDYRSKERDEELVKSEFLNFVMHTDFGTGTHIDSRKIYEKLILGKDSNYNISTIDPNTKNEVFKQVSFVEFMKTISMLDDVRSQKFKIGSVVIPSYMISSLKKNDLFKELNFNLVHNSIGDNMIFNNNMSIERKRDMFSSVTMSRRKLDPSIDAILNAGFKKLSEYAPYTQILDDLISLSFAQHGVNSNPNSYFSIIPAAYKIDRIKKQTDALINRMKSFEDSRQMMRAYLGAFRENFFRRRLDRLVTRFPKRYSEYDDFYTEYDQYADYGVDVEPVKTYDFKLSPRQQGYKMDTVYSIDKVNDEEGNFVYNHITVYKGEYINNGSNNNYRERGYTDPVPRVGRGDKWVGYVYEFKPNTDRDTDVNGNDSNTSSNITPTTVSESVAQQAVTRTGVENTANLMTNLANILNAESPSSEGDSDVRITEAKELQINMTANTNPVTQESEFEFPDGIKIKTEFPLSAEQQALMNHLYEWYVEGKNIEDNEFNNIYLVQGSAGTGKTTTIRYFISYLDAKKHKDASKYLFEMGIAPLVRISAPSHTANKHLYKNINKATNQSGGKIFAMNKDEYDEMAFTTQAAFNTVMVYSSDKGFRFEQKGGNIKPYSKLEGAGLWVIDEIGMFDYPPKIWSKILETVKMYANDHNIKIIMMGDDKQLVSPTTGKTSPFFNLITNKTKLTQEQRQTEGNPLLNLLGQVTRSIDSGKFINPITDFTSIYNPSTDSGVVYFKSLDSGILSMFKNDMYTRDRKFVKYLARDNATVEAANKKIRNIIFDNPTEQYVVGETITGYGALNNADLVMNGQDYIVKSVTSNKLINILDRFTRNLKPSLLVTTIDPDTKQTLSEFITDKLNSIEFLVDELVLEETDSLFGKPVKSTIIVPSKDADINSVAQYYESIKIFDQKIKSLWAKWRNNPHGKYIGSIKKLEKIMAAYMSELQFNKDIYKIPVDGGFTYQPVDQAIKIYEHKYARSNTSKSKYDYVNSMLENTKYIQKNLDYGYASTINKAQGQTLTNVIADLDTVFGRNGSEYWLSDHHRENTMRMLYTILSRATNTAYIKYSKAPTLSKKLDFSGSVIPVQRKPQQEISTQSSYVIPAEKVLKNDNGLVIVENILSEDSKQKIFNILKPQIERQSYKQTAGASSFDFGLRWGRLNIILAPFKKDGMNGKGLALKMIDGIVTGKQLSGLSFTEQDKANLKNIVNNNTSASVIVNKLSNYLINSNLPPYVFNRYDQKGRDLPQIPKTILDELSKVTGMSLSEYDAIYASVYDENDNGSLIFHQDNTEQTKNPIVTASFGLPMEFIAFQLKDPSEFDINNGKVKDPTGNLGSPEYRAEQRARYYNPDGESFILRDGTVLIFEGDNRNVAHKIIYNPKLKGQGMPTYLPDISVNKAYTGLGKPDYFKSTGRYRVVITVRKVLPNADNSIVSSNINTSDSNNNSKDFISGEELYTRLGNKTQTPMITIDDSLGRRPVESHRVVAYRTRGNNFLEALQIDNAIGNPWNSRGYGLYKPNSVKESVVNFADWLLGNRFTDVLQDYRSAILNGDYAGKRIIYYKELNEPSHATALDYILNKLPVANQQNTDTRISPVEASTENQNSIIGNITLSSSEIDKLNSEYEINKYLNNSRRDGIYRLLNDDAEDTNTLVEIFMINKEDNLYLIRIWNDDYGFTLEKGRGYKFYKGKIEQLPSNGILVFGSNEGSSKGAKPTHGAGTAKLAIDRFGAIQGQSRGLQGNSYAIVTKKFYDVMRSSTPEEIKKEIEGLYVFATRNPDKDFYVAYLNDNNNLNGYSSKELADMFASYPVPKNIVFNLGFAKLMGGDAFTASKKSTKVINIASNSNDPLGKALSNMTHRSFKVNNVTYKSVEHAYQSFKIYYADKIDGKNTPANVKLWKSIVNAPSSFDARKLGRSKIEGFQEEKFNKNKEKLMKGLMMKSILTDPELVKSIINTGDAKFTHTLYNRNTGKPYQSDDWTLMIPKILTEIRDELTRAQNSKDNRKVVVAHDFVKSGASTETSNVQDGNVVIIKTKNDTNIDDVMKPLLQVIDKTITIQTNPTQTTPADSVIFPLLRAKGYNNNKGTWSKSITSSYEDLSNNQIEKLKEWEC